MKTIKFGEYEDGVFVQIDDQPAWIENSWGYFDQWITHYAPKDEPVILKYVGNIDDESQISWEVDSADLD